LLLPLDPSVVWQICSMRHLQQGLPLAQPAPRRARQASARACCSAGAAASWALCARQQPLPKCGALGPPQLCFKACFCHSICTSQAQMCMKRNAGPSCGRALLLQQHAKAKSHPGRCVMGHTPFPGSA